MKPVTVRDNWECWNDLQKSLKVTDDGTIQ